jgi:hypothetical protein
MTDQTEQPQVSDPDVDKVLRQQGLMLMQRLGGGHTLGDIAEAVKKVGKEVLATGKAGSVTIEIALGRASQYEPMLVMAETVKVKLPKQSPKSAWVYLVGDDLSARDPRQHELELEAVDGGKVTMTVDRETGDLLHI